MNREIDKLGRLVIPKEMRKQLGLENGDKVNFECKGNQIIITNPNNENIDYKTRCEKAIDVIKEDMYVEPKELYGLVDGEHLLNILQGSDENDK